MKGSVVTGWHGRRVPETRSWRSAAVERNTAVTGRSAWCHVVFCCNCVPSSTHLRSPTQRYHKGFSIHRNATKTQSWPGCNFIPWNRNMTFRTLHCFKLIYMYCLIVHSHYTNHKCNDIYWQRKAFEEQQTLCDKKSSLFRHLTVNTM